MFRIPEKDWFLLIDHQSSRITVRAQIMEFWLRGTIVDEEGAVVPGVKVVLTNLKQGFRRSATTNSKGIFVLSLPPRTFPLSAILEELTILKVGDFSLNNNGEIRRKIEFHQILTQTSNSRFLRDLTIKLASHLIVLFLILISHLILLFLILSFEWSTGQLHNLFS